MSKFAAFTLLGVTAASTLAMAWLYGLRNATRQEVTFQRTDARLEPARLAAQGEIIINTCRPREMPFQVKPHLHLRDVVKDDDLIMVLCAAAPTWTPPTVSVLIHELKLWGVHCEFTREMVGRDYNGQYIAGTLLSDKACRANTVSDGGSYLLDSPYGIRVVELRSLDAVGSRGEGHTGQLLKALAEAGVPSTRLVTTSSSRSGTVSDIFHDAVLRFSFAGELEFIACFLVYWLPAGQRSWKNEFGIESTFDELLSHLISIPYGQGACGGCHIPYAAVVILCLDEESPVLSTDVRANARQWLKELSMHLERHQLPDGAWDRTWPGNPVKFVWGEDLMDRITMTGHHLEWIALAPRDTLPSRPTIMRAVSALRRDVEEISRIPGRSYKTFLPISHAARALVLLKGVDAFSVFRDAWNDGSIKVKQYDKSSPID